MKKLALNISYLIVYFLSVNSTVNAAVSDWGDCVVNDVPTLKCLEVVFGNLVFMSTGLIVLVLFIMLVVGGFNFLMSSGNPEKIKKAMGTLKFAVIGFILFMSSFLILKIIDVLFLGGEGKLFKFEIGVGP